MIEVSGNPDALRTALGLLAHEGVALVASWYGAKDVSLPLGGDFHRRRLTIRSTQVSTIPARLSDRWSSARRRDTVVDLLEISRSTAWQRTRSRSIVRPTRMPRSTADSTG